jgi:hypothetical protein
MRRLVEEVVSDYGERALTSFLPQPFVDAALRDCCRLHVMPDIASSVRDRVSRCSADRP